MTSFASRVAARRPRTPRQSTVQIVDLRAFWIDRATVAAARALKRGSTGKRNRTSCKDAVHQSWLPGALCVIQLRALCARHEYVTT